MSLTQSCFPHSNADAVRHIAFASERPVVYVLECLSDGCVSNMGESTALIVTAHPDDEAMFFGPTIQQLLREGVDIHMLCLSTGVAGSCCACRLTLQLHHATCRMPGGLAACASLTGAGNADGLGTIRHVEMLRACEALGVRIARFVCHTACGVALTHACHACAWRHVA